MATAKKTKRAHKTHCVGDKIEIKTILASSFLSGHSNSILYNTRAQVSLVMKSIIELNDIHEFGSGLVLLYSD